MVFRRISTLLGPLVIVAVGVVLLLNTTGAVSWDVWGQLGRLWPIVIVLLGVSLLLQHLKRP